MRLPLIKRNITKELHLLLQEYPIVTVLGPRQAGKTTLVQHELPDYAYVSLEDPDERMLAAEDPRAFLRRYPGNTIFDEVQRVPALLSYLQGIVDKEQKNGRFVLTGSHQLELRAAVAQSLAGRTGKTMLYMGFCQGYTVRTSGLFEPTPIIIKRILSAMSGS